MRTKLSKWKLRTCKWNYFNWQILSLVVWHRKGYLRPVKLRDRFSWTLACDNDRHTENTFTWTGRSWKFLQPCTWENTTDHHHRPNSESQKQWERVQISTIWSALVCNKPHPLLWARSEIHVKQLIRSLTNSDWEKFQDWWKQYSKKPKWTHESIPKPR